VHELAERLREGEAVEAEFLAALKRAWNATDQVPKGVLDDLAGYVEEYLEERLEEVDPEEAEGLAKRLREGETYASLARTLAPLLKRVVGEEERTGQKRLYVRLPEELHDDLATLAFARGESLNSLIVEAVQCLLRANPVPDLVRRGQLAGERLKCCPEE
jgi:predicted DNA-binding protein